MSANAPARIIFMGSPQFAAVILEALAAAPQISVVAAVCQPAKPAGRGRQLRPAPVAERAAALGIPCLTPRKLRDPQLHAQLAQLQPQLIIVAAYGRILPPALLALPPLGCVNVHASLLPRHRGASPIAHALLAAESETGITLMQMDAGLDTGPMLAKAALPIAAEDDCGSLTRKLATLGAQLLVRSLPALLAGSLTPQVQPEAGVSHAPLLEKSAGFVDFSEDPAALQRRLRAFTPWPQLTTSCRGKRLKLLGLQPTAAPRSPAAGPAGQVCDTSPAGIVVRCGSGYVLLTEVQPEGRAAMPAAAFLAGRGVAVGDILGLPLPPLPTKPG